MEDIFEKKIKKFLPYIIIIAAVYLFMPALLYVFGNKPVLNQIVYIGVFPLVAFGCNFYYTYKNETDWFLAFVAPVLFLPSMFLYGNVRDNLFNSIVFLVSYFICGYLAQLIGEMVSGKSDDDKEKDSDDESIHKREKRPVKKAVPKRISRAQRERHEIEQVQAQSIEMPVSFEEEMAATQSDSDVFEAYGDTTDSSIDDIDAILAEIHSRHEDDIY